MPQRRACFPTEDPERMQRRTVLTAATMAGAASLLPRTPAMAGRPVRGVQAQLPGDIPGDIAEVLGQVDINDVLLLSTVVNLDGTPRCESVDAVAYADVPGNSVPDLPHATELIRHKGVQSLQLTRSGDAELTIHLCKLHVPVEQHGNMIETWRNPVDGFLRPMPPTFIRGARIIWRLAEGRLQLGTPDVVAESASMVSTSVSTLQWSYHIVRSHNLAEQLDIPESYGLSGNVTDSVSATTHIQAPTDFSTVPIAIDTVRQRTGTRPFPPAMAIFPDSVCGQIHTRTTVKSLPGGGVDAAEPWVRDLVRSEYSDLLEPASVSDAPWDDTMWSAFYRDVLEPRGETWAEWTQSSCIKE